MRAVTLAGWHRFSSSPHLLLSALCGIAAIISYKQKDAAEVPPPTTSLDEAVSRVNTRLSAIEKVRRFRTAREPFTIDNEQMTPTMKIRRHVITDAYRSELEGMY